MKQHSEIAWNIASEFSYTLASDTRTLAAMIDVALENERAACASVAEHYPSASISRASTGEKIGKLIRNRRTAT